MHACSEYASPGVEIVGAITDTRSTLHERLEAAGQVACGTTVVLVRGCLPASADSAEVGTEAHWHVDRWTAETTRRGE